ncbi:MAG: prepilin-type N-terminal cleavage/methylation domain-containing protein [Candidatus Riflebacteria bacterium]|nr:prepilin-type N-terminal cleavage/methylation domain-containing protein [Candidatus Riflebacteria bacterium]
MKPINKCCTPRQGMSMIELLIGVTIFGMAMLPIMWLGTSQTRGAYSIGKHMMASQIAASFIDSLLGLPYKECQKKIESLKAQGRTGVLENEDLQATLQVVNDEDIQSDMKTSFRYFQYEFGYDEDEAARILRLNIEIFYRVEEGDDRSLASVRLAVLKFGDRNG